MTVCIFAYGSNMCRQRVRSRVPSARAIETGYLRGHTLRFHKRGRDGSGKADALRTGKPEDRVWGVLVEIDAAEKPILDRYESLGVGYREQAVEILTPGGRRREACVYVARSAMIDPRLRPFCWYKRFVLTGARQHGLPNDYIEFLQRWASVDDPKQPRRRENHRLLDAQPGPVPLLAGKPCPALPGRTAEKGDGG